MPALYIVATLIGNLQDISPRALSVLRSVAFIAAEDTRHTLKLLNSYDIKKPLVAYHKFNERDKSEQLLGRIAAGEDAALVTDAGTPCISDPGDAIVALAHARGIAVYAIPGPSAVAAALSVSGLCPDTFAFYGFLPRDNKARKDTLESIDRNDCRSVVLYESPKRIIELAQTIAATWPQAAVCFCSDLTKLHERTYTGSIEEVLAQLQANPNAELGEYVVVLRKPVKEQQQSAEVVSAEARLLDKMVKTGCTLKQAVEAVAEEGDIKKNELYKASLNLKRMAGEL